MRQPVPVPIEFYLAEINHFKGAQSIGCAFCGCFCITMAQTPSSNPTRTPPRCLYDMQATPRGPQALASLAAPQQGGRPSGAQEWGQNCYFTGFNLVSENLIAVMR